MGSARSTTEGDGNGRGSVDGGREGFARSKFHRTFLGARLERVAPGEVDVSLQVETLHLNLAGTSMGD
jgi:acyl-coenzyme A thioesterase PaaI-like protein